MSVRTTNSLMLGAPMVASLCVALLQGSSVGAAPAAAPASPTVREVPETPLESYNAGTRLLREGKLKEAEAFFENVLLSQLERFQTPSLYNLGHTRFAQGIQELKKGPSQSEVAERGTSAGKSGAEAIRLADDALKSELIDRMVSAYMRGRGARRELKAAIAAVSRAMEAYRSTLTKWQRASGDFRSAVELSPDLKDAAHNADVVDRHIARLVDSLKQMQQMASMLGQQKEELQQKMKQLKGQIPEPDMPPGASGDEDEEEDKPSEPQQGQQEAAPKDGEESRELTPEQASWLLDGFRLDRERRLPMGGNQPDNRNRDKPDW